MILTSLLIYLGVKYHWGDYLKPSLDTSIKLSIPDKIITSVNIQTAEENNSNSFDPEIVKNNTDSTLITSMNKEQITEHCINLLSKGLKDPLTLELTTVNCVVSNYQPTFQNSKKLNNDLEAGLKKKKLLFNQQCKQQYNQSSQNSMLEKQLLVGICVSDKLNIN